MEICGSEKVFFRGFSKGRRRFLGLFTLWLPENEWGKLQRAADVYILASSVSPSSVNRHFKQREKAQARARAREYYGFIGTHRGDLFLL